MVSFSFPGPAYVKCNTYYFCSRCRPHCSLMLVFRVMYCSLILVLRVMYCSLVIKVIYCSVAGVQSDVL